MNGFSIVLPARNEATNLARLLPEIRRLHPAVEILVVDDGSSDNTGEVCAMHGARCIQHPYSMGNGAAIKSGARHAEGDVLVFMDADGQHDPAAITALVECLDHGYEMAVGARSWSAALSSLCSGRSSKSRADSRCPSAWMVRPISKAPGMNTNACPSLCSCSARAVSWAAKSQIAAPEIAERLSR